MAEMNEYRVRVPLGETRGANLFDAILGAFVAEQERSQSEVPRLIGVKTEIREGRKIKCMIFSDRNEVLNFLTYWRQSIAASHGRPLS